MTLGLSAPAYETPLLFKAELGRNGLKIKKAFSLSDIGFGLLE
jgi:hypothetical protein